MERRPILPRLIARDRIASAPMPFEPRTVAARARPTRAREGRIANRKFPERTVQPPSVVVARGLARSALKAVIESSATLVMRPASTTSAKVPASGLP